MEISFDNDGRLCRNSYLFEYKGVRFRLIQNGSRKYAYHLLSILPTGNASEREDTFSIASELISALGWAHKARTSLRECGGRSWPDKWPLSKARARVNTFRTLPFEGQHMGYNINQIPKIETEEQRIALTLYREASASNNDYLSFLFFWQIMEIAGTNAEGFVNKTHRKKPKMLAFRSQDIKSLPLEGRTLGEYLRDECRDAIAHIRRKPGKKKLDLDRIHDRAKITTSTRVVKAFSEYYIREALKLQKRLYLMRKGARGFPTFVDDELIAQHQYEPAYRSKPIAIKL